MNDESDDTEAYVSHLERRVRQLEEEAKNLRLSLADANNALSARENEDMGG